MSPATIDRLCEALRRRPAELAAARAAGTPVVGYFCCNVPEELVLAAGLVPVRLGSGGDERLVELGGRYISHQNCPFVRQNVGVFARAAGEAEGVDDSEEGARSGVGALRSAWAEHVDTVLVAATCPQIYRLGEVIESFFGRRVEILGVPRNFTSDEGRAYFRAEVAALADRLGAIGGQPVTPERLTTTVDLLARTRTAIRRLYDLQAAHPEVLSWRTVFETVHAGFVLDRGEYADLLEDLLAEATALAAEPVAELDDRIRLFLAGSVISPGDTKILDLVEELGARIVGDDLCTGLRPARQLVVKEPTLDALADAYLDRVPCAALPHLTLTGDRRLANIEASYREAGAEGVIYHSLRYCDPITFKANETKQVLGNQIPFLEIHTEYASSDTEGIRTRIDAFLEMIETAYPPKEWTDAAHNA
ncbi:MAG TPA: 2-hydroxyacyl-CoA dehydratase family protein [Kineosporiaceae bacterium]